MTYLLLQEELELLPESFKVKITNDFLQDEESLIYGIKLGLPEFIALFIRKNLDSILEDELFTNDGIICLRTDYESHTNFEIAFTNQPRKSFSINYAIKLPSHAINQGVLYSGKAYNILDFDDVENFEMTVSTNQLWSPDFIGQILYLKNNFKEVLENEGNLKFMDDLILKQGLTLDTGYSMIRKAQEYYLKTRNQ